MADTATGVYRLQCGTHGLRLASVGIRAPGHDERGGGHDEDGALLNRRPHQRSGIDRAAGGEVFQRGGVEDPAADHAERGAAQH